MNTQKFIEIVGPSTFWLVGGILTISLIWYLYKRGSHSWELAKTNIFTLQGIMIFAVWMTLVCGASKLYETFAPNVQAQEIVIKRK